METPAIIVSHIDYKDLYKKNRLWLTNIYCGTRSVQIKVPR